MDDTSMKKTIGRYGSSQAQAETEPLSHSQIKQWIKEELRRRIWEEMDSAMNDYIGNYDYAPGDWHRVLNQSELYLMDATNRFVMLSRGNMKTTKIKEVDCNGD